jgi:hypothetical protein
VKTQIQRDGGHNTSVIVANHCRTSPVVRVITFNRFHKLLLSIVAGFLVVAAGSIAAAVGLSSHAGDLPVTTPTTSSSVVAHWTTPTNEHDAPNISTPGGATYGAGNFNSISCPTSKECVVVGGDNSLNGVAATSMNGGATWSPGNLETGEPELNAVDCWSTNNCVAVGIGAAATSSDGGATWTTHTLPIPNTTLLGVSCSSSTDCVSVGVSPGNSGPLTGQVLFSTDGGVSWTNPSLPGNVGALGSVDCPSSSLCVAVGAQILTSGDGGQKWTQRFVNGGSGILRSVSCSSAANCVAIGPNPAGEVSSRTGAFEIRTTDGGMTWSSEVMPAGTSMLNVISCTGGTDCTVSGLSITGAAAPALTSVDGGATWSIESLPAGITAVSSVNCYSTSSCVFAGLQGSIPVTGSSTQGAPSTVTSVSSQFGSGAAQ